jgi:hypothetical protein
MESHNKNNYEDEHDIFTKSNPQMERVYKTESNFYKNKKTNFNMTRSSSNKIVGETQAQNNRYNSNPNKNR